jgi:hypothetical protein
MYKYSPVILFPTAFIMFFQLLVSG